MTSAGARTMLWKQNGNGFQLVSSPFPDISEASLDWGDYNRDGNLDLLISGLATGGAISKVFQNQGSGTFVDANIPLIPIQNGSAEWIDINADGKLDICLMGAVGTNAALRIYENLGDGTFQEIAHNLAALSDGAISWADIDLDGLPDLAIAGNAPGGPVSSLFRNEGDGQFSPLSAPLEDVSGASLAWADMDADGDPDLLLCGDSGTGHVSRVYRNEGNAVFTSFPANLSGIADGMAGWGDFNDDGYPDIVLIGDEGPGPVGRRSLLYRNNAGTGFVQDVANSNFFEDLNGGAIAKWADIDADGKLDLLLSGQSQQSPLQRAIQVYRNIESTPT